MSFMAFYCIYIVAFLSGISAFIFLRFIILWLRVVFPLGAPFVNTSPGETAPLGSLITGAEPLGTVLGLLVFGEVALAGVVWAEATLVLSSAVASSRKANFIQKS